MVFGRCRILQDWWSDWDNSVHTDEAQVGRQGRAMTYGFEFIVSREDGNAWFSSSSDMPYYVTHLDECTCHDFQERKLPCKHIYRLAVELGLIEIVNRSTGEFVKEKISDVKESSDIDSHPDQLKRQKSALDKKCAPLELNREEKTAVFSGSGKNPYETTMDSCTCRDYFVRKLPCKHIYRLRHELKGDSE